MDGDNSYWRLSTVCCSAQNLSRGSMMLKGWPTVIPLCICTITIIVTRDHISTSNYGGLQLVREA